MLGVKLGVCDDSESITSICFALKIFILLKTAFHSFVRAIFSPRLRCYGVEVYKILKNVNVDLWHVHSAHK